MPRAGRANKAAHELEQDAAFVRAPRQSPYASRRKPARNFLLLLFPPLDGQGVARLHRSSNAVVHLRSARRVGCVSLNWGATAGQRPHPDAAFGIVGPSRKGEVERTE